VKNEPPNIVGAILAAGWFAASVGSPIMGITERVAILVGFQWTFLLSVLVIKSDAVSPHNRNERLEKGTIL
jgi:hypothetical protein